MDDEAPPSFSLRAKKLRSFSFSAIRSPLLSFFLFLERRTTLLFSPRPRTARFFLSSSGEPFSFFFSDEIISNNSSFLPLLRRQVDRDFFFPPSLRALPPQTSGTIPALFPFPSLRGGEKVRALCPRTASSLFLFIMQGKASSVRGLPARGLAEVVVPFFDWSLQ